MADAREVLVAERARAVERAGALERAFSQLAEAQARAGRTTNTTPKAPHWPSNGSTRRRCSIRPGSRVLLMLGNVAPLWEVILAAMKLGAVIIPASTLLQPADLADRLPRGRVRHVVTDAAQTAKFSDIPGDWTPIAIGPGEPDGWHAYAGSFAAPSTFTPDG